MGSRGAQWYSRPEQADQHHGFADFYQRFFGETPSQKTPDTGLTSIRVAKLGNAYTGQPPQRNRSSMLRSAYPPGGNPLDFHVVQRGRVVRRHRLTAGSSVAGMVANGGCQRNAQAKIRLIGGASQSGLAPDCFTIGAQRWTSS